MEKRMNIAIFASGSGSNARKIMEYFQSSGVGRVVLVVCNRKNAGVIGIAAEFGVPVQMIDRNLFYESERLLDVLESYRTDFIALAGFLWLIPGYLIKAYPDRIVNIHPALLPKYGGHGMYGHHVHEAVKAAGDQESGPTIHFVNEHYDEGDIIFQTSCRLSPEDTPEDIARKVLSLEHEHYPRVIEQLLLSQR